jgi:hypothetical protein
MTKEFITKDMLKKMNDVNRSWLLDQGFTHGVTLAFNRKTTLNGGRKSLKRFHAYLDRALLGTHWHKKPNLDRTFFIAFPEHIDSNLHYNLLLRVRDTNIQKTADIIPQIWSKVVPSGSVDVKLVSEAYDYSKLIDYYTKEQMFNIMSYQSYIISNEFLSQ